TPGPAELGRSPHGGTEPHIAARGTERAARRVADGLVDRPCLAMVPAPRPDAAGRPAPQGAGARLRAHHHAAPPGHATSVGGPASSMPRTLIVEPLDKYVVITLYVKPRRLPSHCLAKEKHMTSATMRSPETSTATGAEAEIRSLIDGWLEAVRSKDVARIMAFYDRDVVAFDAIGALRF